ncbi:MAG: AAA family ATPase [Candidatus Saccharimonadales bacterium]
MKKAILITGVSGSGKTTICRTLKKLGYEAHDLESAKNMFMLIDPNTEQVIHDKQLSDLGNGLQADWVCNMPKLKKLIQNQQNEVAFYCGGTSRTEELMQAFDFTVILQVSDETTVKRLSNRKKGEFGNEQVVRDWVLTWKQKVESDWLAAGGIGVNAEPEPHVVAKAVVKIGAQPNSVRSK